MLQAQFVRQKQKRHPRIVAGNGQQTSNDRHRTSDVDLQLCSRPSVLGCLFSSPAGPGEGEDRVPRTTAYDERNSLWLREPRARVR